MISKMKLVAIAVALGCIAMPAASDSYRPSHSCRKPFKPYRFTSEWEVEQFNADVARYKACITDFVDEQNAEALNHQQAAEDAIDEWNRYARFEL